MSVSYYGALELKVSYQRSLGIGLIFTVFGSVTLLALLMILGRRLPEVINEVENGTIIVLSVPKPEPKSPLPQQPQVPTLSQPKLGVFVPDSLFAPEIFDQSAVWLENQKPLDGASEGSLPTSTGGKETSGDTVIDLDLDGLKPVILYKVEPEYPAIARQQGITETVVAELVVGTDGFVRQVVIRDHKTGLFDEEVESTLKQWIFKPLVVAGRVVRFRYLEVVHFSLR